MTSIMDESDRSVGADWGAARAEAKAARKRRRQVALGVTAVVVLAGIPFVDGFIDGVTGAPSRPTPGWVVDSLLVPVLILAIVVGWRNWREMDEVQRALAVQAWAVIGVSGLLLNVLLAIVAKYVTIGGAADIAWFASVAIGMAFYLYRRVRS